MSERSRVVFAVLHLGRSGMEVVSERGGRKRKVNITWHRKDVSDAPPEDWANQVSKELDFQDSDRMPDMG